MNMMIRAKASLISIILLANFFLFLAGPALLLLHDSKSDVSLYFSNSEEEEHETSDSELIVKGFLVFEDAESGLEPELFIRSEMTFTSVFTALQLVSISSPPPEVQV